MWRLGYVTIGFGIVIPVLVDSLVKFWIAPFWLAKRMKIRDMYRQGTSHCRWRNEIGPLRCVFVTEACGLQHQAFSSLLGRVMVIDNLG